MQLCPAGDVVPAMKRAAVVLTFLIAGAAQAGWFDDCDHHARRTAQVDMNGVTRVIVIAKAGSLRVEGHDGARAVSASGEACSSQEDLLRDITLTATRSGSTATIEAHVPSFDGSFFFGGGSAALDLTVSLPANVPVDITDTSGEMIVTNVGTCSIDDSSGGIEVRHLHGDLTIRDSSGAIDVDDVSGSVHIPRDSSGEIEVRHVGGGVAIDEDSSGAVTIRDVKQSVTIGYKGSGSVYVSDVGGDFTIEHKGSGGIDYERVAGRVNIPRRR
jgi:hypothetical protein